MSDLVSLGRVVRRLRTERGISQEGLAALADIDRTFMGQIERAEVNPSFEVIERIAQGLGIRLSELIRAYELETDGIASRGDSSS